MVTISDAIVAYQFQVVISVTMDIPRDITVGHPPGDHTKPLSPRVSGTPMKLRRLGQVLPLGNPSAEPLHSV